MSTTTTSLLKDVLEPCQDFVDPFKADPTRGEFENFGKVTELRLPEGTTWTEHVMGAGYTLKDLCKLLRKKKVIWASPTVFFTADHRFAISGSPYDKLCKFAVQYPDDPKQYDDNCYVFEERTLRADNEYHFPLDADILTWLLAVDGTDDGAMGHADFSGCLLLDTDQCRALASSRGSVRILGCTLSDQGRTMLDAVRTNTGPTALDFRQQRIDMTALCTAMVETQSLQKLHVSSYGGIPALLEAVEQNRSLTSFVISQRSVAGVTQEEWTRAVQSLARHPTLTKVHLGFGLLGMELTDEAKRNRARAVADMLKVNKLLVEFKVPNEADFYDAQILAAEIRPRLLDNEHRAETKRYEAKAKVLSEEQQEPLRRKLVGATLLHPIVSTDYTFMYVFVAKFHDIVAKQYELAGHPGAYDSNGRPSAVPPQTPPRKR